MYIRGYCHRWPCHPLRSVVSKLCCRQLGAWKVAGSVSLRPKPRHRSADMGRWAGDADMQAVAALQGWGAGEGGLG